MNQPQQSRSRIPLLEILITGGILSLIILVIVPELTFHVVFGWSYYLQRTLEKLQLDSPIMLGLLLAAAIICGIMDYLIRSFRSQAASTNQWRILNTLMLLPALIVSMTAGLAFVGAAHHISWLTEEHAIFKESNTGGPQSQNNLKQIVLAGHEYHEKWNSFPAGGTLLAHGIPGHSWETSLLPYMAQGDLFHSIDLNHSWLAQKNKPSFSTTIPPYLNPLLKGESGADPRGYALSHYAGNSYLLGPEKAIRFTQITDGDSNTLFAGEVPANFKPWGDPTNSRDPTLGLKTFPTGFGNPVLDGTTLFSFADGAVRALNNRIDPKILKALATPDGGEPVGRF